MRNRFPYLHQSGLRNSKSFIFMSILSKFLAKRGIEKEEDLLPEEKVIFDKYKAVLSGELVTIPTLKAFMQAQIKTIEDKFASPGQSDKDDTYRKACLHVYLNLLKAIEAPEAERESLEKYLTQLISQ